MRKIVFIIVGLTLLFLAGCGNSAIEDTANSQERGIQSIPEQPSESVENIEGNGMNIVEIISSGFSPKVLTIDAGESVTFINKDSRRSWPASDVHPTHRTYPGSDISKCGSSEESGIFDACRILAQGESYVFTFEEIGEWAYHDHSRPSSTGVIIVK